MVGLAGLACSWFRVPGLVLGRKGLVGWLVEWVCIKKGFFGGGLVFVMLCTCSCYFVMIMFVGGGGGGGGGWFRGVEVVGFIQSITSLFVDDNYLFKCVAWSR
jgi:hypothetical protein